MSLELWALFIPACFALNIYPGPNNLLAMSNGARHGFAAALTVSLARLVAFAGMIVLTGIGLGALLAASETFFIALKWIGAAYLVYLGIRMFAAPVADPDAPSAPHSVRLGMLARQEFFVAASNPKAIVVFTAFFPQFIAPQASFLGQFVILGAAFLILEVVAMALFAAVGAQLKNFVRHQRGLRLVNRASGIALIGAGILLAFARRPAIS